ncbi:MAG TPA: hypothetical protein VF506_00110 [Streptosporangiaceae bacterium]
MPDAAGQVRNADTVKDIHDSDDSRDSQNTQDAQDINGIRDFTEMPVKVLRGLFSGIGQLLLAADRFRAGEAQREGIDQDGQSGPPTGLDGERSGRQVGPSLDATGNVRLLTPDSPPESTSRTRTPSAARTRHKATPPSELPVPGYDGLSRASLRARLRYLDAKQLRILLEHEKSASNRAAVVAMFERRIAKIESGPDAT